VTSWETSFLAMGVALGMSLEETQQALGPEGSVRAEGLGQALGAPTRASRARALATAIGLIAVDVERARLA
jgi:hypothetical protein